jgi:copper chaperone
MKEITLAIEGMTCGGCVRAVTNVLSKLDGVKVDEVIVGKARLHYDEGTVDLPALHAAIERAGFRVT